ncbi:shikimate dehydrogenase [Hoeflea prorocentri]|uniref:Shikimate dehydrogenase (NADP(+)) n=1 Tax=Hoeflea prorocentri TaxID=1922333 RepID=A0A9X3UM50_9HYPH|nr:shikimate dehydrogenase [Hoeflea prorocentri]MCY6383167.1 shikimate dehydrogenase [Hoeflea prorocentri]MDA5400967.1 shikimate dehydrogenase [Hoeflea prorocentri]
MAEIKRAFVAGYPVKHSRSPIIHRYWLDQAGIEGSYELAQVTPDAFPEFMQRLADGSSGFVGGNVTIPHKEDAFRFAGSADALATELGAANTLWLESGRLMATNTDGYGFSANLDERAPGWDKTETAVVLGAGGASRAILQTLRDRGIKTIRLVNRTVSRAEDLADRFGDSIHVHALNDLGAAVAGAGLFVNTSALGMEGSPVPDIDFSSMAKNGVVTDIVYTPLVTPILQRAAEAGCHTVDGLGMLLHQAVPGFEKWFGIRPAVTDDLRNRIVQDLEVH